MFEKSINVQLSLTGSDICPSAEQVFEYQKRWDTLVNYRLQESSLKKLFTKTYPKNVDMDDVLIKVCALNDFYSTNIFSPFMIAQNIIEKTLTNVWQTGS